jgi:ribosome-associated translation inhibitor RaiA/cold shock CspA family protein
MPDGVLQWFDEKTGEGVVVRGGRRFPVRAGEIEAKARRAGARVHFDVERDHGVERAVDVVTREGARTGHRHARFGTLVGARRPDTKGAAPFSTPHPELGRMLVEHPLEVAQAWADAISRGEVDAALALCAPEMRLHLPGHDLTGRRQLEAYFEQHPAFGCRRRAELRGSGSDVEVRFEPNGPEVAVPGMKCRVRHGWIVEQWPLEAERPTAEVAVGEEGKRLALETVVGRNVGQVEVDYAHERLGQLASRLGEPVLFARVKLDVDPDPARSRPARAEALLDLNGDALRAHVAAHTLREAVDLLEERLVDQLQHRHARREALRRSSGQAEPGEWRHGDLRTVRPEYFDRPVEERELVRLKSFADEELTPEEAVFDMDQLDYDFYLFRDLATGADSLVERDRSGQVLLTRLGAPDAQSGSSVIALSGKVPPRLGLDEAIELLNLSGERFVFYEDAGTGRGNVLYRRYDGHYGLIVPD